MMAHLLETGFKTVVPEVAIAERCVPLPTYLVSRNCTVNGEAFSSGGGRYARVFTGVTDGWVSPPGAIATAEDIEAHLGEIEDQSSYIVPLQMVEELQALGKHIGKIHGTEIR
jgi:hypothetical protein